MMMIMMVMMIIITIIAIYYYYYYYYCYYYFTIIIQVHHDKECPSYPVLCNKCNKDEIPRAKVIILIYCEQSLFFFRFSKGVHAGANVDARCEKRRRQLAKKKGRLHSQSKWNISWPHNAKYDCLMRNALSTNYQ